MLVKDLQFEGKGIFYFMNQTESLPFAEAVEIETLDKLFYSLHGMKPVSTSTACLMLQGGINAENMGELAKVLLLMYGISWGRLYSLMAEELPLETYSMQTTETIEGTEETSSEMSSETTRQDLDKVSGFNDSSMVEDTSKDVESSDSVQNTGTRAEDKTISKVTKGFQNNQAVERKRMIEFIKQNLIFDVVFGNVVGYVGSLMY